ncbi:ParA family protein [Aestuariimicrobium sp. T2.26MG-19.2B]|uniref:ParA family protein n=1 Tax=Aestuariimicrobium sp. T2.26MG-19.2B TaxID=3040679 RepID=UPI0024775525|nr:ParA family protein [Aestuariimicrobium sp. T2.26MG-19.2B]CAI9411564.1 hypothetical protein AESSP_02676 [Aestuariimicrobium sp. T2.26MG-19.2B]
MAKICAVVSRKGGVGKSTIAYEVAQCLGAVLVDLEWDGGSVSRAWGYRAEERARDVLMAAIEHDRAPRPLTGFRKPDLVPGSPELVDVGLDPEAWADLLTTWAGEWGREWVVIDTHPGASASTHGAMAAANVVLVPTGLRTRDLDAVEQIVAEAADYPMVVVPNMVPRIPPAPEIKRLGAMVHGTPVRVGVPIPHVSKIATRKRRMAMSAEDPTPRALEDAVDGYRRLAELVKEYGA